MPSSYRIIKNCNISCADEGTWVIDTKIDNIIQDDYMKKDPEGEYDGGIGIDDIRGEIRRELLLQIEQERLSIIEATKHDAEKLKLEYKQKGYEEGLKKGYEQGFDQGISEAQDEAYSIKNNAISLIHQAQQYLSEYFIENRDNIINLAADMAESIINFTIDTSSENIVMLIKPILQQFKNKENIIITCHPDNVDYIKLSMYQLENICQNAKLMILEDNNLERNGCIIENEHQIIDLQIRKQLDDIIKEIKNSE